MYACLEIRFIVLYRDISFTLRTHEISLNKNNSHGSLDKDMVNYSLVLVICPEAYPYTRGIHTLYNRLYLLEPLWKFRIPLDGSKCHLFHLLTIHTPEALPLGMVQPITAAMLERFQNLNKTSQPNHSYQSL